MNFITYKLTRVTYIKITIMIITALKHFENQHTINVKLISKKKLKPKTSIFHIHPSPTREILINL
jgi:hypothetical protein